MMTKNRLGELFLINIKAECLHCYSSNVVKNNIKNILPILVL